MIDYAQILVVNYPNTEWVLNGESYEKLNWLSDLPKPTQAELDELWDSTQATIISQKQAEVAAKESALSKLTALGLTADEVKALLGVQA